MATVSKTIPFSTIFAGCGTGKDTAANGGRYFLGSTPGNLTVTVSAADVTLDKNGVSASSWQPTVSISRSSGQDAEPIGVSVFFLPEEAPSSLTLVSRSPGSPSTPDGAYRQIYTGRFADKSTALSESYNGQSLNEYRIEKYMFSDMLPNVSIPSGQASIAMHPCIGIVVSGQDMNPNSQYYGSTVCAFYKLDIKPFTATYDSTCISHNIKLETYPYQKPHSWMNSDYSYGGLSFFTAWVYGINMRIPTADSSSSEPIDYMNNIAFYQSDGTPIASLSKTQSSTTFTNGSNGYKQFANFKPGSYFYNTNLVMPMDVDEYEFYAVVTTNLGFTQRIDLVKPLVMGSSPTIQVESVERVNGDGELDDEGAYARIECSYSRRQPNLYADSLLTITTSVYNGDALAASDVTAIDTYDSSYGTGGISTLIEGTVLITLGGSLSVENAYGIAIEVDDDIYAPGETSAVLQTAFITMDLLGDGFLYNQTTDIAIDPSKTYYTRTGLGTQLSPYIYEEVEEPDVADIGDYFEANGPRPGHGVSFGAPVKEEGFHVAMDEFHTADETHGGTVNFTGEMQANAKQVYPYLVFDTLAWTSANLSACQAAVADYRPCVARFSNGAVVEFDDDSQTDAYN